RTLSERARKAGRRQPRGDLTRRGWRARAEPENPGTPGRRASLTSRCGRARAPIVGPHYAASKAGLHGLTHHLRPAWRDGVTVNAIAPALRSPAVALDAVDLFVEDPPAPNQRSSLVSRHAPESASHRLAPP